MPAQTFEDLGFQPVETPVTTPNPAPPAPNFEALGFVPVQDQTFRGTGAGATWNPETTGEKIGRIAKAGAAMGINGVMTTAGGVVGAAGGTAVAPGAGTVVGGMAGSAAGNALGQTINQELGLQDGFSKGQLAASAIGGAVPGANLAGAGLGRVLYEASKAAGVNVTAANIQSLIDDGTLQSGWGDAFAAAGGVGGTLVGKALAGGKPTPSPKDVVRKAAQAEGYAFDPVEANAGPVNRALGSFAGTANIKADASLKNQVVTNQLGAQAIGQAGQPLTQKTINDAWAQANIPMNNLKSVSPEIAQAVDDLRQARYDADNAMYKYNTSQPGVSLKKNPAMKAAADNATQMVLQKDQDLAALAQQAGVPELYTDYVASRAQQAKVGAVDENFDPSTNTLSAKGLGKMLDAGAPLSDELRLIAETHNNFDDWMKDGPDVVKPGSNKINFVAAASLAGEGLHKFGAPGAALGALPFLDAPTRSLLLSPMGQTLLAQPPPVPANAGAMLGKLAMMNATRPDPAMVNALAQGPQ